MLPREHGAYGQLLFPLATAIAMGAPTTASTGLAIAALAIFVLHEPALVLVGARGERARRDTGALARRWLITCTVIAAAGGGIGAATLPGAVRWTLAVPIFAGLGALTWSVRGQERTTAGEVAAGVALSSVALPVGVAAGVPSAAAAACGVAFAVGTAAATLCVRALIGRARGLPHTPSPRAAMVGSVALLALAGLFAITGVMHRAVFWGALPMTGAALAIVVVAPAPRFLRRVGWTLIVATAMTAAVLIIAS